jgi:hypothetical protein
MSDTEPETNPQRKPTSTLARRRVAVRGRWNRLVNTSEAISDRRIRKWSELWETIILSVATLVTAWAGYQAGQWNSLQTAMNVQAHTLQLQSGALDGRAGQLQLIDFAAFANWADATADGNRVKARLHEAQFREEFRPAFVAWLALEPLTNPDAPSSPFEMPEYRLLTLDEAARLRLQAEALNISAVEAGDTADQYTLSVVILAGALLLAGLASRFEWEELRAVVVALALLILLGSVFFVIWLPMAD